VTPIRVKPASAIKGRTETRTVCAAARIVAVLSVGAGNVCDRVARVKSSNRIRRTTVRHNPMSRAQPGRDAVHQPSQGGLEFGTGQPTAAECALRPDRPAPTTNLNRARIAIVGQSVQVPA
jgi:hypothetical protein